MGFSDWFKAPEPSPPAEPQVNEPTVVGALPTTSRERLEKRIRIYSLALQQNEKGPERAEVLQGYIDNHRLRIEAIIKAEEAQKASAEAEKVKHRGK